MKLIHPDWEKQITLDGEKVPLISIENPACLYRTLTEIREECLTGKGQFILSEGEKELDMKKHFLPILSPWDMDFNDRKLITRLVSRMTGLAEGESFYQKSNELCSRVVEWMEELAMEMPLPLSYDLDIDIEALLKALHLHIDEAGMGLEERMLTFMKTWNILCGDTGFAFYGFRNLMDRDNRSLFYENGKAENYQFLFLEGPCNDRIEEEDLFIIDKDLCQIFE